LVKIPFPKFMAAEVVKFTGARPSAYDTYLGPFLFEPYGKAMADRVPVEGTTSLLELASGTGRVTRHLRERLPADVKITATDLSPDMMEVAKTKIRGVEFAVADMQNLPFPDNTFDVVVCQFGLMFPPDKPKVFVEVWRVLKPGGTFLFATWERADRVPIFKLIYNDHVIPFFDGEDPNRFVVPYSMNDPVQLKALLQSAQFGEAGVERVVLKGVAESAESLVKGFFTTHAIGREVYDRDPVAHDAIVKKMERAIIDRFGDKPVECELAAYFGHGIKK
jgi:ubiquinone/menaquinone biosynthesis C-methylase UbiE